MSTSVDRLARYEERSAAPMTALAVAFLVLYATPIIRPDMPSTVLAAFAALNLALWVLFAGDLLVRAALSGRPAGYIVRHPVDVLLVALPMLRPLRVLRVFTALQVLIRQGGRVSIGQTLGGAFGAAGLLMFVGAVAMLDAEREAESTIDTFGDSLWWAGVTVTTVGYGDTYPVTVVGRMVAFGLMLVGVSLLGVITASIAAWFVGRVEEAEADISADVKALREELTLLRRDLRGE